MASPLAVGGRREVRNLVVSLTLLGLTPQFVGCAAARGAGRKPAAAPAHEQAGAEAAGAAAATSSPAGAGTTVSSEIVRASAQEPARRPQPPRSWWERTKLRRDIRRGAIVGKEGAQEASRFAKTAAAFALIGSAIAGLLWLGFEANNHVLDLGSNGGNSGVGSN